MGNTWCARAAGACGPGGEERACTVSCLANGALARKLAEQPPASWGQPRDGVVKKHGSYNWRNAHDLGCISRTHPSTTSCIHQQLSPSRRPHSTSSNSSDLRDTGGTNGDHILSEAQPVSVGCAAKCIMSTSELILPTRGALRVRAGEDRRLGPLTGEGTGTPVHPCLGRWLQVE